MTDPTIVMDCHAVCHAAKHAFGGLTWEDAHTGIIYGFLSKLLKLSKDFNTTKFIFAWDSGKSFRRQLYEGYKHREPLDLTPEEKALEAELYKQFGTLRVKVLPALGFRNIFIQTGHEADDVIASIVMKNSNKFVVASDDQDLYQLLDHCDLWKIRKKKLYTKENLKKEWNCTPQQWARQKIYSGCKGDTVPNVPGVGEKRALQFVKGSSMVKKYKEACACADPEFLERNKKLVVLPFEGTREFEIVEDEVTLEKVVEVCEFYGLYSLLSVDRIKVWKTFCYQK